MPTVEISHTAEVIQPLPPICVKTGASTRDRLTMTGRATPTWSRALIIFGPAPWLVASLASSKPYRVVLPMRSKVWRRYRKWHRVAYLLAAAGVLLTALSLAQDRPYPFLALGITALGAVVGGVNEWMNAVGVLLSRQGGLVLTRVHANFQEAMRRGETRAPTEAVPTDERQL